MKLLQNILTEGKEKKKIKMFQNLEDKVISMIEKIEQHHKLYTESMETENIFKIKLESIQNENGEIVINALNAEKKVERKRLVFLKWFAIFIEALLSYNAINLFLKETIGIKLASGSDEVSGLVTIVKSLVIAVPVAFIFLKGTLNFKYNDHKYYSDRKGFMSYWFNYSWVLAICLIPFLNLFIVLKHPGHESNIMWILFSVITLLINIKLADYSSQYNQLSKEKEIEQKVKPINESIVKEKTNQNTIRKKVQVIFVNLTKPANEFRRMYETFGENKPSLTLNPIYRIFLNTYKYYMQVLPTGEIVITNPPAEFSNYFQFLDKTISP
ncbi:MAG: hypothetical protein IPG78_03550 [Ignavibacteria bacterium]|nr:hypothetical protein [Ignavibacteria bacterium]